MSYNEVREAIVDACRRLEAEGLVAGSSGNVSVRLPVHDGEGRYAITPSSIAYRVLVPAQVLIINENADPVDGKGVPSTETLMHLAVYRERPDVAAVIHSHSICASALAVSGEDLPVLIDEQVVALGGPTVCAEWGAPASQDLAEKAIAGLSYRAAVLLRSHGALCVGRTLDEALDAASLLERLCKTYLHTRAFNRIERLPENVVDVEIKFYKMRHGLRVED
jgi:L-fuculose-phosphate aldolase